MVTGIIGKKVGMTQLFLEDGTLEPATVLQAGPCIVVQSKSGQTDGYDAVQIGLVESNPPRHANKALTGHHKKANVPATRVQREVKIAKGADAPKPGDQVLATIFNQGERVDVIGTSKGHGFQGVVKRHHFRGGDGTHGSMHHRAPGGIGASAFPSRVIKGLRGAGHMGAETITTKNIQVVEIDAENNLLVVKGAVPGSISSYVVVNKAGTRRTGK
jgi:large subunit ribosomal protein L3